jgi:hypothetical protein
MPEEIRTWHPQHKAWVTRQGFTPVVRRGQRVDVGQAFVHVVKPVGGGSGGSSVTLIHVYASTEVEPRFIPQVCAGPARVLAQA